jgi:uncharacterized protein (TIGR02117 family)
MSKTVERKSRRWWRWCRRLLFALIAPPLLYFLAGLALGYLPSGGSYEPVENGVAIWVVTNGVHLSLELPSEAAGFDWRMKLGETPADPWRDGSRTVLVGHGDRAFYLNVPEWSDLSVGVALSAMLWPSPCAMHFSYFSRPPEPGPERRRLTISEESYRRLAQHVESFLQRDQAGVPLLIPNAGYFKSGADEFFEAKGSYHLFYTCNTWVAAALKEAGLPAPVWTPFDFPVFWHLPD